MYKGPSRSSLSGPPDPARCCYAGKPPTKIRSSRTPLGGFTARDRWCLGQSLFKPKIISSLYSIRYTVQLTTSTIGSVLFNFSITVHHRSTQTDGHMRIKTKSKPRRIVIDALIRRGDIGCDFLLLHVSRTFDGPGDRLGTFAVAE